MRSCIKLDLFYRKAGMNIVDHRAMFFCLFLFFCCNVRGDISWRPRTILSSHITMVKSSLLHKVVRQNRIKNVATVTRIIKCKEFNPVFCLISESRACRLSVPHIVLSLRKLFLQIAHTQKGLFRIRLHRCCTRYMMVSLKRVS